MDTVQLQCGSCKKVMAISVAHLGQQVQCPHCRSVVQTPAPAGDPGAETLALPPPPPPPAPSAPPPVDMRIPESAVTAAAPEFPPPAPAPFADAPDLATPSTAPSSEGDADLTQFKPKPREDRTVYLVIALIFLVPYALTMTFFVVFLLMYRGDSGDKFEYLPDPMPGKKEGGPRRVQKKQPKHDEPLAAHRKTILGKPVQAGDLLVTPLRVVHTSEGDLKLLLRAKNTSTNSAFEPMNDYYVNEKKSSVPPYTFLETRSKNFRNIYGGYLAYHKTLNAKDEPEGFALLSPQEEVTIALATHDNYRNPHVATLTKSTSDTFTWRVQLRRGFVKINGKDVPATTVIGVDFTSKDIEQEGKS